MGIATPIGLDEALQGRVLDRGRIDGITTVLSQRLIPAEAFVIGRQLDAVLQQQAVAMPIRRAAREQLGHNRGGAFRGHLAVVVGDLVVEGGSAQVEGRDRESGSVQGTTF